MKICLSVSTEYTNVTGGWTDTHDGIVRIASRGNKTQSNGLLYGIVKILSLLDSAITMQQEICYISHRTLNVSAECQGVDRPYYLSQHAVHVAVEQTRQRLVAASLCEGFVQFAEDRLQLAGSSSSAVQLG